MYIQSVVGDTKENREMVREQDIELTIMEGFSYNGKIWSGGTVYDPENGKTYKCKLTLRKDGRLEVRGYIGFSLIGRTEIWTRAE